MLFPLKVVKEWRKCFALQAEQEIKPSSFWRLASRTSWVGDFVASWGARARVEDDILETNVRLVLNQLYVVASCT